MCNTKNGLSKKPLISTQPLKEKKINEQISVRYQEGNHLDEININYKEKVYDGQFLVEFLWIYKTLMITIDLCKKHARVYIFPF